MSHARAPGRRAVDHRLAEALRFGDGGWPLPAAGGRRRGDPDSLAPPDQTCPLQSNQRTKTSNPILGPLRAFQPAIACLRPLKSRSGPGAARTVLRHFISTFAPASSSFFFAASASALLMP